MATITIIGKKGIETFGRNLVGKITVDRSSTEKITGGKFLERTGG